MEEKESLIETLFEKIEDYGKINLELFKLKAINTSADLVSSIVSKLAVFVVIIIIVISLNTGLALWIGDLLGKSYYGFFIVAAFYVLIALILYLVPGIVKAPINDSIILKMLNKERDEKEFTKCNAWWGNWASGK